MGNKSVLPEPAAGRPGAHWLRFVDGQRAALEFFAVELGNSVVPALLHLDEAKTLRLAGRAIGNDMNCLNRTGLCEQFLQFSFRRLKRQIPDIEFLFHVNHLLSERSY